MAHTVTFKLNKPAQQFAAGESTGFAIRGGVKYYDFKSKTEKWTNYKAAVFVKSLPQIDFNAKNLIEGAVVSVSGESIAVEEFQGNSGLQITLILNNARIEYIASPSAAHPQKEQQQRVAPAHSAPQQPAGFDSFDDDIPF